MGLLASDEGLLHEGAAAAAISGLALFTELQRGLLQRSSDPPLRAGPAPNGTGLNEGLLHEGAATPAVQGLHQRLNEGLLRRSSDRASSPPPPGAAGLNEGLLYEGAATGGAAPADGAGQRAGLNEGLLHGGAATPGAVAAVRAPVGQASTKGCST